MEVVWRENMKKWTQNAKKTIVTMKYAVACEDKNGLKPEYKWHIPLKKKKGCWKTGGTVTEGHQDG